MGELNEDRMWCCGGGKVTAASPMHRTGGGHGWLNIPSFALQTFGSHETPLLLYNGVINKYCCKSKGKKYSKKSQMLLEKFAAAEW